ncbi:MAG: ABC transporter substrate-binding protein [Acidobacteria bacterium]|nr:ABC transporter substrate-binding protein [Acidobacteriota bacterium]
MDRRQVIYLGAAALGVGCGGAPGLTVGAKNFTEQDILGELLVGHLRRRLGMEPKQRLHLGGSFVAHEALVTGGIDLYPEYSGTALTACLKLPLERDPGVVFERVKAAYASRHQVEWGWRLGFSNTFAMVMRRGEAERLGLKTLSEAVAKFSGWRGGVGYEFEQRADGWKSFVGTYPLVVKGGLKTMDLGLIYRALGAGEVDMVAGNSTDAALVDERFVALADDRSFFPPYETCLAVREAALAAHSGLRGALDRLTGKITVERMRGWNAAVTVERKSPAAIVAGFLQELG